MGSASIYPLHIHCQYTPGDILWFFSMQETGTVKQQHAVTENAAASAAAPMGDTDTTAKQSDYDQLQAKRSHSAVLESCKQGVCFGFQEL